MVLLGMVTLANFNKFMKMVIAVQQLPEQNKW